MAEARRKSNEGGHGEIRGIGDKRRLKIGVSPPEFVCRIMSASGALTNERSPRDGGATTTMRAVRRRNPPRTDRNDAGNPSLREVQRGNRRRIRAKGASNQHG